MGPLWPAARSHVRCLIIIVASLLSAACAVRPPVADPAAAPPLALSGRRILVLPVRAAPDLAQLATRADSEIAFALAERNPAATWIFPPDLRAALRRSPGLAIDPAALPDDPALDRGDAPVGEVLAGPLRRYAALADARLVLLPRLIRGTRDGVAVLRLHAAAIDARTGGVIWRGSAERPESADLPPGALAELAAAWAERLSGTAQ